MTCVEFETEQPEILIARLSRFSFEGFQELEHAIHAYIDDDDWNALHSQIIDATKDIAMLIKASPLPEINWNAEWEKSFTPVLIDRFCAIRASFHPPVNVCEYEIIIDPKMAFGTGHHETTELMIRQMQHLHFRNKAVLDLGCGTGILAILSALRKSEDVIAMDNDPEAVQNAIENSDLNKVSLECLEGTIDKLPSLRFDVVLANINRNTLLSIMQELKRVMRQDAVLLLSGFLEEDAEAIQSEAEKQGLHLTGKQALGEWQCHLYAMSK